MNKRPVLTIPKIKTEWLHDIISIASLLFSFGYLAYIWQDLPATIAIHFNFRGEADGWGSKAVLFILPPITLLLYVAMTALRKIPHYFNYPIPITEENADRTYRLTLLMLSWIKLEMTLLLGYMQWSIAQAALERASGLGQWLLPSALAAIFGTIAIFLVRLIKK